MFGICLNRGLRIPTCPMAIRLILPFICSQLFLFFPYQAFSHPDIDLLVKNIIAESEKMAQVIKLSSFKEDVHLEKLDSQWYPQITKDIHFLVGPGGEPLNLEKFSEKERKFVHSEARITREALETLFSLHEAIHRFELKFVREETSNVGEPFYIIDFFPKKNLPYRTRMEKVCNFLSGRLKIRKKDFSVSEAKVTLTEPVDLFWFLARLEKLSFYYASKNLPEGSFPETIDFIYHLALPLKSIKEHEMIRISEYQFAHSEITAKPNIQTVQKDGL
ncbi:hypothetical protein [Methylacidiphilum sp. Yel]|uniref:hypothetical protein n=1 Tax=Methylacidiphilum sp. Yel TaxID=1847730 RepID=UPI001ABD28DE|nr:hypothetical protein [Methylacidiphilum sp. Yel]